MGLLSTPADGQVDTSVEDTADDGGQVDEQQAAEPAPPPAIERAPLPAKPTSRREAARQEREAFTKQFAELQESVSKQSEDLRRQLSERDQQIARLMGSLETLQKIPARGQTSAEDDAERIEREAQEALDRGDLAGFRRRERELAVMEAERRLSEKYKLGQQQAPQQPPMDPRLLAIMSTPTAAKVLSHQRGMELAATKDRELAILGYADGPQRWQKAMELADASLFGTSTKTNESAAGALAGVPSTRASGKGAGSSVPSVKLPPGWERVAAAAEMSKEDYIRSYAELHPEAVEQ